MEQSPMNISMELWNSWNIVAIEGKFIVKFVADIRKALELLKDQTNPKIAFDLSKTTHLDSCAMTLILNYQNRLKEKEGGLVAFGPNEDIMGIITIVGLDSFVPIYHTRADFERSITSGRQ
jgi:anti-anti-sigma factor